MIHGLPIRVSTFNIYIACSTTKGAKNLIRRAVAAHHLLGQPDNGSRSIRPFCWGRYQDYKYLFRKLIPPANRSAETHRLHYEFSSMFWHLFKSFSLKNRKTFRSSSSISREYRFLKVKKNVMISEKKKRYKNYSCKKAEANSWQSSPYNEDKKISAFKRLSETVIDPTSWDTH